MLPLVKSSAPTTVVSIVNDTPVELLTVTLPNVVLWVPAIVCAIEPLKIAVEPASSV
jgi:hypothetical protein